MKHFSVLKGIDDVLITSKFIPTLSASTRCVSYDLTRLITQKSSCGEMRHLYLSFLHLWMRGVCARGRPSHSLTVLISGLMDLRLCFWERQALVGALTAGDGGNKASLWLRIWDWDQTSFKITQPRPQWRSLPFMLCLHHYFTLFHHLHSRRSSFLPLLELFPLEPPRPHAIRCLAGIVILGTWEIKSLLTSDDAPARRNELPFVLIQTSRVPSYSPQGCLCTTVSGWSSHVMEYFIKTL